MALSAKSVALDVVEREIDAIIKEADEGSIVANVDKILVLMEKHNMAYRARLGPRVVGVDPSNRDGYGVNYEDVHALGHDIAMIGFSWQEVIHAVCVELGGCDW
jgi:hypothetical protein